MSGKISGMVWDADLPRNLKYVLLAYADHADHEGGGVFPSTDLVAWKTGYKRRNVISLKQELVDEKYLEQTGVTKEGTPIYKMVIENLPQRVPWRKYKSTHYKGKERGAKIAPLPNKPSEPTGVQKTALGVQKTALGVQPTAPEPSLEPSLEPSSGASPEIPELDGFFPREENGQTPTDNSPITEIELFTVYGRAGLDEKTIQAEKDVIGSGWEIRNANIRKGIVLFVANTPFSVPPGDADRGGWIKAIKDHADRHGLKALPKLYKAAYKKLHDAQALPSGPWGLTKTMEALATAQEYKSGQSDYTPLGGDPELLEQYRVRR